MSDPKIKVAGFQMEWPHLTKKEQEENPLMYQYALSYIKSKKALEGFRAKRINKANSRGTKITFEAFESIEEAGAYMKELNEEGEKIIEQIPEMAAAVKAMKEAKIEQKAEKETI